MQESLVEPHNIGVRNIGAGSQGNFS